MADPQAVVAAENRVAELAGKPADKTFRRAVICIMVSLSKGILVRRDHKRTTILPPRRPLHWGKRIFEAKHLGNYRKGALSGGAGMGYADQP